MAWTDGRVETLKRLLGTRGMSAAQMARHINAEHPDEEHVVTRNAVIGKVHRMGLCLDASQGRRNSTAAAKSNNQERKRNQVAKTRGNPALRALYQQECEPLPPPADGDIARVSFADLEPHHCRFIPGDPAKNFSATAPLYCGCDAVPGLSYCAHHAQRVFQPPEPSRKASALPRVTMLHASMDSTKALDEFEKA